MGANIKSHNGKLPISVSKSNISNSYSYKLPVASAQVKSCLLLAAIASKNDINLIELKLLGITLKGWLSILEEL